MTYYKTRYSLCQLPAFSFIINHTSQGNQTSEAGNQCRQGNQLDL